MVKKKTVKKVSKKKSVPTKKTIKKVTKKVLKKKTTKLAPKKKSAPKIKVIAKKTDYDIVEVPHEYADELIKLNQILRSHREHERDKHIERIEKKLQNALDEIKDMEGEHAAKEDGYPYVKIKVEPMVVKPYHRKSRPPTAYNEFIKQNIDAGATFSQAVKMWKAHKELEENKRKGIMGRLFKKKAKKESKPEAKKESVVQKGAMGYMRMAKESIAKGQIDISLISNAIIEVLEAKKKIKIDDLSKELGLKPGRILEIVAVIESHDIRVKYPLVGKPKLVLIGKKK